MAGVSDRWLHRSAPLITTAAALLVYANSLANGFAFDDVHIIETNPRVHDLSAWPQIFRSPYWPHFGEQLGLYRPVIILLYAVQWALGGGAPWVFHAFSMLLHAAATLLVFRLLERFTSRFPALAGSLIFAVHPVHTEAVANIVGQAELVVAVALLGAVLIHVQRPDGMAVSWARRLAILLLFTAAIFTKESGIVLPGLLVATDLAQRRVPAAWPAVRAYVSAMGMTFTLLGTAVAVYLLIRVEVLSGFLIGMDAAPALPYIGEQHRLLNALRAFPEFLRLLVMPIQLAADYAPGVLLPVEAVGPNVMFGLALLVATTICALTTPIRPALGLPAAWFLVSISIVSNLLFPIGVLVAERTLYLPSVAVSFAVAFGWAAWRDRRGAEDRASESATARRMTPAALPAVGLVVVLVLFTVRTWTRNPDWASTDAVVAAMTRDHPEGYRVQWTRAQKFIEQGRLDEGYAHYTLAHRLYSRDAQMLMAFGQFLLSTNRADQGIQLLEEAVGLQQSIPRPVRLLAHAYLVEARYEDALRTLDEASARGVHSLALHPVRAYAHHGLGQHRRAIASWRAALDDPDGVPWATAAYLARAFALAGDGPRAFHAIAQARDFGAGLDALARIDALEAAVAANCYAVDPADVPVVIPPCDPLGDWFIARGDAPVPTALHIPAEAPAARVAGGTGAAAEPGS